jgi:putative membrane protein
MNMLREGHKERLYMAGRRYQWEMLGLLGTALLFMLYSSPEAFSQKPASSLSQDDITFLNDAAQGGLNEVRMGEMAKRISTNDRIKNLGQKMVDDHAMMNQDFRKLAARKNVVLPGEISPKQEAGNKAIGENKGRSFDTAYIEAMLKNHKEDLAAFKKEASEAADPDVKGLASRSISVIEEHLRLAKSIAVDLGIPIAIDDTP